jgi:hypothetical protein
MRRKRLGSSFQQNAHGSQMMYQVISFFLDVLKSQLRRLAPLGTELGVSLQSALHAAYFKITHWTENKRKIFSMFYSINIIGFCIFAIYVALKIIIFCDMAIQKILHLNHSYSFVFYGL